MDLDHLDDAQLGLVLQHLVSRYDKTGELVITDAQLAARLATDRAYLDELAATAGVEPGGTEPTVREVVEALVAGVPDIGPTVAEGAEQAARRGTLPLSGMPADILVIAASAAILRPRLRIKRSVKDKQSELDIRAELGGLKGLDAVLTVILDYLRRTTST